MSLEAITNFVLLADDLGTSGQPTREQFADISAAGFGAVVNLALPTSDHAIADEGAVVTGLGMSYCHVPVIFESPTLSDLRLFLGVMKALEGRKTWVHCVVNARVSAFCYHYLRHIRGLSEENARSPILDAWTPRMTQVWRDFLAIPPAALGDA